MSIRSTSRLPPPLALLVLANAVSLSGNVVMTVAIPWLVLSTTGSAALTGLAVFAGIGGSTAGSLAASRVVDRLGLVRTAAVADLLSSLAVVPLPLLLAGGHLSVWHVVVLAAAGSLADASGSAARQSLVPAVADARGYPRERANALFTSAEHAGYLLGAPAAGLLVAVVGVGGALWVTVTTFAVAALVVGRCVRVAPAPRPRDGGARPVGVAETVAFIRSDRTLWALVLFPTLAVVLVAPLVPLVLPVLAHDRFEDPVVLGAMVAGYGAGGLAGAAAFGWLGARARRRRVYAGVFVALPATYAVITAGSPLPLLLAALITLGAAAGALVPLQATVRQERSPAHLLPAVVSLSTATVPVAGPVGVLATGVLVDGVGPTTTLALLTGGAVILGAAVLVDRGIGDLDRPPLAVPADSPDDLVADPGGPAQPHTAASSSASTASSTSPLKSGVRATVT